MSVALYSHGVLLTNLLGLTTSYAFLAGPAWLPSSSVLESRAMRSSNQFPAWPSRVGVASERLMMAGFGGGQAEKPKETPKSLTSGEAVARTALKEYNDLKREGGVVAQVYARQKDTDDEWLPVGYVCTEAGKTAEGIQGQKRLILEHALEIHEDLKSTGSKKLVLEAGYSIGEEGEVILSKAKYNGERVGVALDPRPTGPYFRNVGPGGFAKDMSSAATLADRAKFK
ncbi:unnamed protein product [Ascophyllum nodosum]